MTRRILGPFNRVEGDLEVKIDVEDGRVRESWVTSPLYRGFETMLVGKSPRDALVYAPRICGICSVSQSVAAARALGAAQALTAARNGLLATDLMLAVENIADHLTHFHLFFMPDFCRETYRGEPWFESAATRFRAVQGEAAAPFLAARANVLHMLGLLAGKWPHTLAIQPGGSTRPIEAQEKVRLTLTLRAFRKYLEGEIYGGPLEEFSALSSLADLENWAAKSGRGALRHFLTIAHALRLAAMGRAEDRFLSFGSFGLFRPGLLLKGVEGRLDATRIAEDVSHSWLRGEGPALHPRDGRTLTNADKADGYTWCKAPRLEGQSMEVGALARQAVDGQPLARALAVQEGGNVRSRIIARFIEIARLLPAMEGWVAALAPREPWCETAPFPDEGHGAGLAEAARGALGHWVSLKGGLIANYQIVAPTTWNFSPRDAQGHPGPLERALVGAPVRAGESDPVSVQHIVRSFDPCMVCTVH